MVDGGNARSQYDPNLLYKVQLAMLAGSFTAPALLSEIPNLATLEIAEEYLIRAQILYRDANLNLDVNAERAKMVAIHWQIISRIEKKFKLSELTLEAGQMARLLTVIQKSEQRISTLLGLDAPQKMDLRLNATIQSLGPRAQADQLQSYEDRALAMIRAAMPELPMVSQQQQQQSQQPITIDQIDEEVEKTTLLAEEVVEGLHVHD